MEKTLIIIAYRLSTEAAKSRSRQSNDNALAESKNASVVRKTFGYSHIEQHWADELNVFNREYLNPFHNYHRPCYFPTIITDEKGKQRKKYRYDKMLTPYEKLKSLEKTEVVNIFPLPFCTKFNLQNTKLYY